MTRLDLPQYGEFRWKLANSIPQQSRPKASMRRNSCANMASTSSRQRSKMAGSSLSGCVRGRATRQSCAHFGHDLANHILDFGNTCSPSFEGVALSAAFQYVTRRERVVLPYMRCLIGRKPRQNLAKVGCQSIDLTRHELEAFLFFRHFLFPGCELLQTQPTMAMREGQARRGKFPRRAYEVPPGGGSSQLSAHLRAAQVLRWRRAATRPGLMSSDQARGGGPSRPVFYSNYACGPP